MLLRLEAPPCKLDPQIPHGPSHQVANLHPQPAHNINVSLIARSNYTPISTAGVHLTTHTFGDYTFHPAAVYSSISACAAAATAWDYIWITTKALPDSANSTAEAALIAPLLSPSSVLVLIQNGVGIEAPYRTLYPPTPIITGVAFVSAEQIAPGMVKQNLGGRLPLGPYLTSPSSASSPPHDGLLRLTTHTTAHLASLLTHHGLLHDIETHSPSAIQLIRWHKVSINAAMNPTSILAGGRGVGRMALDAELHKHLRGVMREIWEATPQILHLLDDHQDYQEQQQQQQQTRTMYAELAPPDATLEMVKKFPDSRPSMLQDWEAGRPLEVEVILGNPVRIARERGVELPRTQSLYAMVRSLQAVRDAAKGNPKAQGLL